MVSQPSLLIARAWRTRRANRAALALAAAASALGVATAVLANPLLALLAKALIDPLFHSTSAGGAVALLGLLAVGAAGIALAPARPSLTAARAAALLLVACIVTGNAANLLAHLVLLDQNGMPWHSAVYHWAGDTNTYSYVLHSHAGKAALHALLTGWSSPLTQGFDIGAGLAGQLAPAWGAVFLLTLTGAVVAWAGLLPVVMARWPGWPMALLFTFCGLNGLKTIADGGPLTYRFAPVLATLLLMLPSALHASRRIKVAAATLAVTTLAISTTLTLWLAGPQMDEALDGLLVTLTVIGALLAWAWQATTSAGRRLRAVAGLVCSLGLASSVAASLVATPLAMLAPLPMDMQATVCDGVSGTCARHAVGGQRAFDVYRNAGDDPLKPRHTLIAPAPGHTQAGRGSHLLFAIHPLRTQARAERTSNPVTVRPLFRLRRGDGVLVEARSTELPAIFDTAASPFSAANYYVFLHQVAAALRAQGLADFTMAPLRSSADAQALGLETEPTPVGP